MKKTKTICFANNKGGSGKSTTCSNVGYGLRELGYKVLLIDGDMQLNLSLSLFDEDQVLAFAQSEKNLYEGLKIYHLYRFTGTSELIPVLHPPEDRTEDSYSVLPVLPHLSPDCRSPPS